MPDCKTRLLMSLAGLVLAGATSPAMAERNVPPASFQGPAAVCLSHTRLVYSCITLSPSGFQSWRDTPGTVAAPRPLNAVDGSRGWLVRLGTGDGRDSARQGDGRNRAWDLPPSDPAMKMSVIGSLTFEVYTEDGDLSDSRFFLGFDRAW
jgi:hypothetical protein